MSFGKLGSLGKGFGTFGSGGSLVPSWVLSGAAVDLDFANARYFGGTLASLLSITRASNGYATNADGSLTNFGSNVLRIGVGTGLLIEEARTNLLQFSEDMTNGIWASNGGTLTGNVGVAPNGATTAGQIVAAAVNNGNYNTGSGVQGIATYTASGFMKLISGGPNLAFLASGQGPFGGTGGDRLLTFNGSTGAFVSKATEISSFTITPSVNGWFRVTATFTTTASSAINVGFFAGAAETFQAWGVQLEAGAFATSYIPTTTATATRAADNITLGTAIKALLNGASGQVFMQFFGINSTLFPVMLSGNNGNNSILEQSSNTVGVTFNGSASLSATLGTGSWSAGPVKSVTSWTPSGRTLVINNGTEASDAGLIATSPPSTWWLGSLAGSSRFANTPISRLTFWNAPLGAAARKALTV